jgi:hypothetical protein
VQLLESGVQRPGGEVLPTKPIPDFLLEMVRAKGLLNVLKARIKSGEIQAFPEL